MLQAVQPNGQRQPRIAPVIDCPGYFVDRDGRFYSNKSGTLKPLSLRRVGKVVLVTVCVNGRETSHCLSHLVLAAFGRPRPGDEYMVKHRDGDRFNCAFGNLQWFKRWRLKR